MSVKLQKVNMAFFIQGSESSLIELPLALDDQCDQLRFTVVPRNRLERFFREDLPERLVVQRG